MRSQSALALLPTLSGLAILALLLALQTQATAPRVQLLRHHAVTLPLHAIAGRAEIAAIRAAGVPAQSPAHRIKCLIAKTI